MLKFLKRIFVGKPISPEVQILIDALNADRVGRPKWKYSGAVAVMYNGEEIKASRTDVRCYVNIGETEDCLPKHEAKAVFRAMYKHTKRREKLDREVHKIRTELEVRRKLGNFDNGKG